MSRPQVTRLRERFDAPPSETVVIDARYNEVGRRKRGFLHKLSVAMFAVLLAAVIGFLIPPAWMFWELSARSAD